MKLIQEIRGWKWFNFDEWIEYKTETLSLNNNAVAYIQHVLFVYI